MSNLFDMSLVMGRRRRSGPAPPSFSPMWAEYEPYGAYGGMQSDYLNVMPAPYLGYESLDDVEKATRDLMAAETDLEKAKESYEEAKKKLEECEQKLQDADDKLKRSKYFVGRRYS